MLFDVLFLLGGLGLLIIGANVLVKGASALAASLGVSTFVIGLTVVAMGTSAPEASLAVISSWEGDASISFGNIIGANLTNIGVVLASACLVCPIPSGMTLLRREAVFLVVSIAAVASLGLNGSIDLGDSLVLIVAGLAFNYFVVRSAKLERAAKYAEEGGGRVGMGRGKERYNRRLCSVSLAGWPCRVSLRCKSGVSAANAPAHHPKDKSWSSFDSPAAAPRAGLSTTSSLPTSACAATAASSNAWASTTRRPRKAKKACASRKTA